MKEEVADHEGKQVKADGASEKKYFVRLTYAERAQHMIFVACFIVLATTGLMRKVPEDLVMMTLGQAREAVFYYRGILHRTAATVMILTSLFHIFYLIFTASGRRWLADMIPKPKDLKDLVGTFLYYLGVRDKPPEYDRFSYKHKLEYGGLIAGNTLMTVTGLIMWTEALWNKFVLDLAMLVHGMEAMLACLAIMIWHLYEVHLRPHKYPMSNVWINGVIDEAEMKAEYPLYYDRIMSDTSLQKTCIKTKEV